MTSMEQRSATEWNAKAIRMISEAAWQEHIRELAALFGWRYYHTWRSQHSPSGFPDCVLVRGDRCIFAELKVEGARPTQTQREWLAALRAVPGIEVYVWTPSQREEVVEVLT